MIAAAQVYQTRADMTYQTGKHVHLFSGGKLVFLLFFNTFKNFIFIFLILFFQFFFFKI